MIYHMIYHISYMNLVVLFRFEVLPKNPGTTRDLFRYYQRFFRYYQKIQVLPEIVSGTTRESNARQSCSNGWKPQLVR